MTDVAETQTSLDRQIAKWQTFFDLLGEMDRGQLAKLRHSLSNRPAHFLTGTIYAAELEHSLKNDWQRAVLETVAGLFALIERPHDEQTEDEEVRREQRKRQPLGQLLGELHIAQNRKSGRKLDASSSIEKRFLALLDSDEYALPYQLRQAITLLDASEIKPDWSQLTNDLMFWQSRSGNRIRQDWSDAFYLVAEKEMRRIANLDSTNAQAPETPSEDTP
ncbi:hypothetical protein Dxin01_02136 [Deinococcus xinjiangensis]|uniref:Type I-E CRISPR-associated protein Cse2/CasB n=1 Tax=Deinococcus xinjiangensis TaxID=457454 RepID=A0ABP9VAV0_9DEIO